MWSPDHRCEEFELAAEAWEWLHTEGFVATWDHLAFEHPDGRKARLFLPRGERADETASITIFASRAKRFGFGAGITASTRLNYGAINEYEKSLKNFAHQKCGHGQ